MKGISLDISSDKNLIISPGSLFQCGAWKLFLVNGWQVLHNEILTALGWGPCQSGDGPVLRCKPPFTINFPNLLIRRNVRRWVKTGWFQNVTRNRNDWMENSQLMFRTHVTHKTIALKPAQIQRALFSEVSLDLYMLLVCRFRTERFRQIAFYVRTQWVSAHGVTT